MMGVNNQKAGKNDRQKVLGVKRRILSGSGAERFSTREAFVKPAAAFE